jgi:predicted enzyme related to lactoylglutathione lyase
MKRAVAFDRDVLGLRATEESEDSSALNVGGLRVGLDSTEGKPTPKRAILTLKTNDVRADAKRLQDKGVRFVSEIGDYDWGSVVTFEDSEGNYLKLMQPPKGGAMSEPTIGSSRN